MSQSFRKNIGCACLMICICSCETDIPGEQVKRSSGDLLEAIKIISGGMPGRESEGFVKPSNFELERWRELTLLLLDGEIQAAEDLVKANFPFYRLIRFTDAGFKNRVYLLLKETTPIRKGWGTFILNLDYDRELSIAVPHPIYDINTDIEGADIFRRTGARLLMIAGTHRCANSEFTLCDGVFCGCGERRYPVSDMAHSVASVFQKTHEVISDRGEQLYSINLHGHGRVECQDIFLSSGLIDSSQQILVSLKSEILLNSGLTVAVAGDGTSDCPLIGSTNVQGRFTNGSIDPCTKPASRTTGRFIHIEQSRSVRDNSRAYSTLVSAINETIVSIKNLY